MHRLVKPLVFATLASIACLATAQSTAVVGGSAPGKAGVAHVVTLRASITAIDAATRDVTLKGPQGNEVVVTAGPEVKNFANMHVGDQVDVRYVEAVTLELKKGGGNAVTRSTETAAKGAAPGAQPAGAVGRQVTVVADVIALDPKAQTVTLRGPRREVTLTVADPEQFKRIAKGDQVEATYTQALALVVEPATKK